jgi:hypothetical protein
MTSPYLLMKKTMQCDIGVYENFGINVKFAPLFSRCITLESFKIPFEIIWNVTKGTGDVVRISNSTSSYIFGLKNINKIYE